MFFSGDDRARLERIEKLLMQMQKEEREMAVSYKEEVARLTADMEKATTVNRSVLGLLETFISQLHTLSDDPSAEAVDALADAWEASVDEVQAAVVANTVAAEEPPVGA
jgi:hypothetical protein